VSDVPVALVVARDPVLIESILAAVAAAGCRPVVVREADPARRRWRSASAVLIGVEMAPMIQRLGLAQRPAVVVVGAEIADLALWSVPLAASVLVLPSQVSALTAMLSGCSGGAEGKARVVRLVGGSGGLGVSTLACALAHVAASRESIAAVVELDESGGRLDLVVGAEREPGWRWPELRSAAGHIGDLRGRLPNVDGVDIVSHGSGRAATARRAIEDADQLNGPGAEAMTAVVSSLARTHELVVLDAGRGENTVAGLWANSRTLLVAGADVRSVVAARARLQLLGMTDADVVVRTGRGRHLDPLGVADSLGLPLFGVVNDDDSLPLALENGDPPGHRRRRRYTRDVERLLDAISA